MPAIRRNIVMQTLGFSTLMFINIVGLTGCDQINKSAKQDSTSTEKMPPPTVDVMAVQLQSIPLTSTFSGRTVPYQTADVRPQTSGIVEEITFQEGGAVKQGQVLYRLNSDDYQASAMGNQAMVEQADAQVQTAKASYESAVANLATQQALLAQAHDDKNRYESLVSINAVSQQQVEQARTNFKTAQAAVANAQAAVKQAQANVVSSEAGIKTAKAQLSASSITLNRTLVTAPIDGTTNRSSVNVGSLVSAGQPTPMVTISQINPIYVDINQSSADLLALKKQQASGNIELRKPVVELILEDGTTYPTEGQLLLAEAKVDDATGSVTLRAIFNNDNYLLLPGMFVTAKVKQGIIRQAVLLPQSALIRTPKGETQVYVVDNADKISIRPVVVDGTHAGKWIITEGLQTGDRVVMVGGSKVRPEQKVTVKPYVDDALSNQPQGSNAMDVTTSKSVASANNQANSKPISMMPTKQPINDLSLNQTSPDTNLKNTADASDSDAQ